MVKIITHPTSGKTFKLGRRRPVTKGFHLKLSNYLHEARAAQIVPSYGDYGGAAKPALENIYMNDTLGDCVIAAMGHVEGVLTGNAGDLVTYGQEQIIAEYSAIGGYVPGDPSTDNGCDEVTALNYWMTHGFPNGHHRIAGWMTVDPLNALEFKAALYLFENLYFGVELPDAWINPMPAEPGFGWWVNGPPDPNNGHAFCAFGWTPKNLLIDTWGMTGYLSDPAVSAYCTEKAGGELYTVISQDAIRKASQRAPNALDWSQLVADFDSMGGNIKVTG